MQKETDTESIIITNDEIMDEHNINGEISYHHNSAEVIDPICDENRINSFNKEEEADVTSINYSNATNNIYMNYYEIFIHKYYAPFLSSNNNEDVFS